jgi:hypothetical protein
MSHNVPAVWNVFSYSKKPEVFSTSNDATIHPQNMPVKRFLQNFKKKILSAKILKT